MEALILLVVFIILDIAAIYWGIDSRDGINNPEWKRRQVRGRSF
jgi:hypothetical protein